MKNLIKRIITATTATLVAAGMSAVIFSGSANAIVWTPNTTGLDHPGFNVFTGVPGVGDESDFVRGRVSGSSNDFSDPVNDACADGTQYSVRVYVHNGANQTLNNNGTGPGVAHDTKVKVNIPALTSDKITGTISASNAATVNDTLAINCNGSAMELSYVSGSAIEQRIDGSTSPLGDNIVSSGALIGTKTPNGDVWGCFEQRVIVYLKVKVSKPAPTVSKGECKVTDVKVFDNRKVRVSITGKTTNATIVGYLTDFGDGSTSGNQTSEHQYAKDGTFKIVSKVQVKFADGHTEWLTSEACNRTVTFKPGEPPVVVPPVTPTTLPSTGPGDIVGIFAATTVAGALVHRFVLSRRYR